jgi:predicted permease
LDLQAADIWVPLASMPNPSWLTKPWWETDNLMWYRAVMRVPRQFAEDDFEMRATQNLRAANSLETTMARDTTLLVRLANIVDARGPAQPGQEMIISTRLSAVALIVLLIACANVINLLLARAVRRRRETAVRLTLGISRRRLLRLFAVESMLLALMAAAAALVVGVWGGTLLRTILIPDVAWHESVMHWRVVVFTLGIALLAGFVAGMLPARQASMPDLTKDLRDGTRAGARRSRLRSSLIVVQAALSVLLLSGAGLFMRSLVNVRALDIGYDAGQLLYGRALFEEGEKLPLPIWDANMLRVAQELRREASIEGVARAAMIPMQGFSIVELYRQNGSELTFPQQHPALSSVSAEFFRTAGIRVLKGRVFTASDGSQPRAELIVNERMASMAWPGEEPLGQCLRIDQSPTSECFLVVGVVENVNFLRVIEDAATPQYYVPLGKLPGDWIGSTVVVRTKPNATANARAAIASAIKRAFPNEDASVVAMSETLEPEYRPWRVGATLFTAFGLLALLVAVVGIYSTVSYAVSQRTHEFGVRMALGAHLQDIVTHVVRGGVKIVAMGVALGLALTLAAGRLIVAMLYGVHPYDPAVLTGVSALLLGAAAIAALMPAWRAARVDPVRALKSE